MHDHYCPTCSNVYQHDDPDCIDHYETECEYCWKLRMAEEM